jgi:hypothetical protein
MLCLPTFFLDLNIPITYHSLAHDVKGFGKDFGGVLNHTLMNLTCKRLQTGLEMPKVFYLQRFFGMSHD